MKIHEYQAKALLRRAGVAVPDGQVASSPEEAAEAYDHLGGRGAVVKAQIHAGGRGKARPVSGVQRVKDRDDARRAAEEMFRNRLITHQTGPEGKAVHTVLVQQDVAIARELYLGLVIDRARQAVVLMASREGGVEIEEVAARTPEKILKEYLDPDRGLVSGFQARKVAYGLGLEGKLVPKADPFIRNLCTLFLAEDCSLAEINPLVVTRAGDLVALDCKMNFDDNAAFRHPEWAALRDPTEEDPAELRAQAAGLSYIQLNGTIGCLVNGAGLAMSTMDIIKFHGGEPANFLDVGGGADKDQVTEAFRILLADPHVRAVLVNIFGGIMKCDTIATAILAAYNEVGFHVPLVVRLEGTHVEQGKQILADSGKPIITANDLTDAAQKVVAAAGHGS